MANITLSYFDFNGGRGEDCRLGLHIAGAEFVDNRLDRAAWLEFKPRAPWGSVPTLEVDGAMIGQSNAILGWIGRTYGLHPTDPWQAARHEAVLSAVEELRAKLEVTMSEKEPAKRLAAREAAAAGFLQDFGRRFEREIGGGPFLAGDAVSVADLKLFVVCKWLRGGVLDHIPTTVWDAYPKLVALHEAVLAHPAVAAWYAAH